jgi:16S rRNA (cytosine967-C5)-methyltransferase
MASTFSRVIDLAKLNVQLCAAHILRDVIDQGRSLDKTLRSQAVRTAASQRPLLQELAYGGCRHYYYLDGLMARLLAKPIRKKDRMVHFLLVIGLYQLAFMRTPNHAVVNQTVKALEASRQSWARGLLNGVLREYLRRKEGDEISAMEQSLTPSQNCAFPPFLYQAISDCWADQAAEIFAASNQKPPMTLRINKQKTTRKDYLSLLNSRQMPALQTLDCDTGLVMKQPTTVDKLPMFAEGWVSVQDESAQLCTAALLLQPGLRVLDACAAPGGKTCAILESEPGIQLTAIDLPERVEGIRQNLERTGLQAEIQDAGLEQFADWWDGKPWDRILLDVPCSGTGVIRRHPDIRHRRLPGDFERFARQQLDLLNIAWPMLGKSGILLYVTCSIMTIENDQVIENFVAGNENVTVEPINHIQGLETRYGLQRLPGVHDSDGFYYCRLRKL